MKPQNTAVQVSSPHNMVVKLDEKSSSNHFRSNSCMVQLTKLVTKDYWIHHTTLWKPEQAIALPQSLKLYRKIFKLQI